MRRDFQIALVLAIAALPAGLAVSEALEFFPFLKEQPGFPFVVSLTVTFVLLVIAVGLAVKGEQETNHYGVNRNMTPLIGMIISGSVFLGCCAWFLWSARTELERNAPDRSAIQQSAQDLAPVITALKNSEVALAESEQTRGLFARILKQYDQLNSGVAAMESMTGKPNESGRLAAAEHIIQELRVVADNIRQQPTSQGTILFIKTAPNTFRITFAVPIRIPPEITFMGLPTGATPQIIEKSSLGFTVIFTPPTTNVEHFDFTASAEL